MSWPKSIETFDDYKQNIIKNCGVSSRMPPIKFKTMTIEVLQQTIESIRVLTEIIKNPVNHSKEVLDAANAKLLKLINMLVC